MTMSAAILCPALCYSDVMKTCQRAAILCPAACSIDVINKAGTCGKSGKHIRSQLLLLFIGQELTNMAVPLGAQIQSHSELRFKALRSSDSKPFGAQI